MMHEESDKQRNREIVFDTVHHYYKTDNLYEVFI